METQQTFAQFVEALQITMRADQISARPDDNSQWAKDASHWACEFSRPETTRTIKATYSQGSAHTKRKQVAFREYRNVPMTPECVDVLSCLASDASSADQPFEDWASDFGYDTDSRKALATYEACVRTRHDLIAFLGRDHYQALMDCEPL